MPVLDVNKLIENRVEAIRSYHETTGIKRAQLDVSGGVDSAVMLGLLAKAVGPDNITAVYSSINSSKNSRQRAQETADVFGVKLIDLNLTDVFNRVICEMRRGLIEAGYDDAEVERLCFADSGDPTVLGSIRSCIRAPIGRGLNRMTGGGIRHGTGNECEDRWLRFYQKGGDGEVDTNPIAMLSKGEVFQLAVGLGVPTSVLTATPSPDLQGVGEAGHNDEDELKALTGVDWTYSKVNPETGEYTSVGTIEKMSRMADVYNKTEVHGYDSKYDSQDPFFCSWPEHVAGIVRDFKYDTYFSDDIVKFTLSAKKIEVSTRHKMNPNCPALGTRQQLLHQGVLTDVLPEL